MTADLLLDTHVAIWYAKGDERARRLLGSDEDDDSTTISVSVSSWIEIAIKHSAGTLDVGVADVREPLMSNGFLELPMVTGHARALELLPYHHRDPFDRILVAQAIGEEMTLVSSDPALRAYRANGLSLRH